MVGNERSVAVECIPEFCHSFGIYIFAKSDSLDEKIYEENAAIIRTEFLKQHKLYVPEIIFIESGFLRAYTCNNCRDVHKFHLRDDYLSKRIADNIHYISRALNNPVAKTLP